MTVAALGATSLSGCQPTAAPPAPVSVAPTPAPDIGLAALSENTSWPWPKAGQSTLMRGVTHWLTTSRDGTSCELMQFDFKANPRLRFELYAQDEDDKKPFDNNIQFWQLGVGQAVRKLNAKLGAKGTVVAAANGPFFGYRRVSKRVQNEIGFHLAPVVLRGRVYHNIGNHRWTMGVKYFEGRPQFKTFHLPGRKTLEKEFDFASGTVQCLIKDNQPLQLERFPRGPNDFKKQPVPSTADEVGHIPYFDHAKFSRTALAWNSDSSKLYWLIVREPQGDSEGISIDRLSQWKTQSGGWNVPDVQRFWLSMNRQGMISDAINSDAGDVGQLAYRLPNGNYELVSPIGDNPKFARREFTPDFKGAPEGGAVMYFVMKESRD